MKITQVKVENYTVFQSEKFVLGDAINVFIGENGTGKTHLMKLMYSASQAADTRASFSNKIVRTMLPDDYNISRLLTRKQGAAHSTVRVTAKNDETDTSKNLSISFHSKTKKWDADVTGEQGWESEFQGESSIFIPAKEILSNSYNLNAAVEKGNIIFDDTYLDILNSAKVDASLGRNEASRSKMLKEIEKIIDGKVVYDSQKDTFYLKKGNSKQEFNLVSEGIRKMALIWQLVKNGMLDKGSILFWDEPEANINPTYIPVIVDLLLALSKSGVQVFIATHDYFLSKYIDARKNEEDNVVYHSLYKDNGKISYEVSKEFGLLEKNGILEAARMLYREEIGVI
ncbi:MAG: AAA family ATPase [Eubacteriales bacterium]|nr:AAA family ATPase [Eubacteriales bacterium]